MKNILLALYYLILIRLPHSSVPFVGKLTERIKEFVIRGIFVKTGKNINVGKGARFGKGYNIKIGNNSGIGMNCKVPDNIIIGDNVMMGPNVQIFGSNHRFDRTDIPMIKQGYTKYDPVIIEDDVWIGASVIIMPGIRIMRGTIIGAGSVVTKSFPEYSIIAGNPAKKIKSRLDVV